MANKRTIQLQFPDNMAHTIEVEGLTYNSKYNIYVLQYYDLTLDGVSNRNLRYTILEKKDNEFIVNPKLKEVINSHYGYAMENIQMLDANILPDFIRCQSSEKTNQQAPANQKIKKIPVYKDQTNKNVVYIPYEIAKNLGIKHKNSKVINNTNCVQVTVGDIAYIKAVTKNDNTALVPEDIIISNLQTQRNFTVYKDQQNSNIMYIDLQLANQFHIPVRSNRIINNTNCAQVTVGDIKYIQNKTKDSSTALVPKAKVLPNIQAQTKFPVYTDQLNNNIVYIPIALANTLGIKYQNSKVIENTNCVQVTVGDIKYIQEKTKYNQNPLVAEVKVVPNLQPKTNFAVYTDQINQNIVYIDSRLAAYFNIPVKSNKVINNINCAQVTVGDIAYIQEKTKDSSYAFVPVNIPVANLQKHANFAVYTDPQTNNKYITVDLANDYGLINNVKRPTATINGNQCVLVNDADLAYIYQKSKNETTVLHAEEIKIAKIQSQSRFPVYRDTENNYRYIEIPLAKQFGLTNRPTVTINGNKCVLVNYADIVYINQRSKSTANVLYANDVPINKTQIQQHAYFPVYKDQQLNNTLYININLATRYGIPIRGKRTINGADCVAVSQADLKYIHEKSKGEGTILYANEVAINNNVKAPVQQQQGPIKQKIYFKVYKASTNELYIDAKLANKYGVIGQGYRIIDGTANVKVGVEAIAYIQENTKNTLEQLIPNYTKLPEVKNAEKFTVYTDKENNRVFIDANLAKRFNIASRGNKTIGGANFVQVADIDILYIQDATKNSKTPLIPEIIHVRSKKQPQVQVNNQANNQAKPQVKVHAVGQPGILVYRVLDENKLYLPKIIADNYVISNDIKKIDNVEVVRVDKEILDKILNTINGKAIYTNVFNLYTTSTKEILVNRNVFEEIRKSGINVENKPVTIKNQNFYSISQKTLEEFTNKNKCVVIGHTIAKEGQIIVYKDMATNKYYIKEEDLTDNRLKVNPRVFNNKKCYEISEEALRKLNKNVTTVSIYGHNENTLVKELTYKDGKYYLSADFARECGINIPNLHMNSIALSPEALLEIKDEQKILGKKLTYTVAKHNPFEIGKAKPADKINDGNEIVPTNKEEQVFKKLYTDWYKQISINGPHIGSTANELMKVIEKNKNNKHFAVMLVSIDPDFINIVDESFKKDKDIAKIVYQNDPLKAELLMDEQVIAQVAKENGVTKRPQQDSDKEVFERANNKMMALSTDVNIDNKIKEKNIEKVIEIIGKHKNDKDFALYIARHNPMLIEELNPEFKKDKDVVRAVYYSDNFEDNKKYVDSEVMAQVEREEKLSKDKNEFDNIYTKFIEYFNNNDQNNSDYYYNQLIELLKKHENDKDFILHVIKHNPYLALSTTNPQLRKDIDVAREAYKYDPEIAKQFISKELIAQIEKEKENKKQPQVQEKTPKKDDKEIFKKIHDDYITNLTNDNYSSKQEGFNKRRELNELLEKHEKDKDFILYVLDLEDAEITCVRSIHPELKRDMDVAKKIYLTDPTRARTYLDDKIVETIDKALGKEKDVVPQNEDQEIFKSCHETLKKYLGRDNLTPAEEENKNSTINMLSELLKKHVDDKEFVVFIASLGDFDLYARSIRPEFKKDMDVAKKVYLTNAKYVTKYCLGEDVALQAKKELEAVKVKTSSTDELEQMMDYGNVNIEKIKPINTDEENFSKTYAEWDMKSSRRFASNAATREFDDLGSILERMLHKHKDDKHFVLLAISYNVSFIMDVDDKWRKDIDVVRVAYKNNPEAAKSYMDKDVVAQVEKEVMLEETSGKKGEGKGEGKGEEEETGYGYGY